VVPDKPRKRLPGLEDLTHPLLGDQPTLQLLPDKSQIRGFGAGGDKDKGPGFFMRLLGPKAPPPSKPLVSGALSRYLMRSPCFRASGIAAVVQWYFRSSNAALLLVLSRSVRVWSLVVPLDNWKKQPFAATPP
jgi:hypothetical protein